MGIQASEADALAAPADPASSVPLAYHRECVACGYDLVGQRPDGRCPECNAPVRDTQQHPLWPLTCPAALARSRWAFRLAALAFLTMLACGGAAVAASVMIVPRDDAFVTVNVVIAAAMLVAACVLLSALLLMGFGAGRPAWRRWAPLSAALVLVLWSVLGRGVFTPGRLHWSAEAVTVTLVWAGGVSMQAAAVAVSRGLPRRAAFVRARRVLTITRALLLVPVVAMWAFVTEMALLAQIDSWTYIRATNFALYSAVGSIALWLLLAAVHWLRLLPFMAAAPPRTLEP